ncbi:hypothetical protein ACVI1J_003104 [Bradyrhizobium diazoefficiens]|jgi:hypothetical protein
MDDCVFPQAANLVDDAAFVSTPVLTMRKLSRSGERPSLAAPRAFAASPNQPYDEFSATSFA